MEIPALSAWKVSSREYIAKLCHSHGRCICQRSAPCTQTSGYLYIQCTNILCTPEQVPISGYFDSLGKIPNQHHMHFSSTAIANYLYRANNNLTRDSGKVNGILRWRYYREEVERIVTTNSSTLQPLISPRDTIMDSLTELHKHLTQECTRKGKPPPPPPRKKV